MTGDVGCLQKTILDFISCEMNINFKVFSSNMEGRICSDLLSSLVVTKQGNKELSRNVKIMKNIA